MLTSDSPLDTMDVLIKQALNNSTLKDDEAVQKLTRKNMPRHTDVFDQATTNA